MPPLRRPALILAVLVIGFAALSGTALPARDLPLRLSDQEFWQLSVDASEPGGFFRSADITNLTSNEMGYQLVLGDLVTRVQHGRVYLGVGPEQNYTYIAALRPGLAIIFDIRRGNLDLQLMYKALFELAEDRAAFVAMLFGRTRPAGLWARSTAEAIFSAVGELPPSQAVFERTLAAIERQLKTVHGFPLPARDLDGVHTVYETFYRSGYAVRASPTYADLMTATDGSGTPRSFLASESAFAFLKDLQSRNLVVPVVGDFGGPRALRAIGTRLSRFGATVGAFYLSNVEQYLVQDGKWDAFCRNVATLPLDNGSTFIRSESGGGGIGSGRGFVSSLGSIRDEVRSCMMAGR